MAEENATPEITEEVVETPAEETQVEETATEEVVENVETTEEAPAEEKKSKKPAKEAAPKKASHGKQHQASVAQIDRDKRYSLAEAIELVKKTSYTKFDGSFDVHINLAPSKKGEDAVRGTVVLPHGTGRERRVIVINDEMIEKIEKGFLDFDVAVATPDMMPKLAKLAKILGPKGLMPNPKSGTVTPDTAKAVEELKGGKVEFKADSLGNIHQSLGKVSWDATKLTENFQTFIGALPKNKLKNVTIAPTMGAGAKVQL